MRQVFGRTGSRSVVLVRFRSSYVVNSIITAKSVLLDGRSPVSIEFSRSSALRQEHRGGGGLQVASMCRALCPPMLSRLRKEGRKFTCMP